LKIYDTGDNNSEWIAKDESKTSNCGGWYSAHLLFMIIKGLFQSNQMNETSLSQEDNF
jgi:hypothetical protein